MVRLRSWVRPHLVAVAIAGLLTACSAGRPSFTISQWGALREVLHEGKSEGRVQLGEVCRGKTIMGVGAVEGLRGEILVLDGVPYVSAVGPDGKPVTSTGSAADVAATLLILADVPAWRELPIDRAIDSKEFDTTIRELALRAGVDVQAPFPFVVTGRAMSLEGHVINRACPTASANGSRDQHAPHRLAGIHDQEVTLVGFYAESGAGVITHHDSRTHVHVLLREGSPMVAHVESVSLAGGACFKLPYRNR